MTLRLSGLASGMDTESIIRDMMNVARMPLDKLTKKQQTLEWKRDDYRSVNTLLLNFRTELADMNYTSAYRVRSVSSTDESKVTATATNVSNLSSYTLSDVSQLAKAEVQLNNGPITNGDIDTTKSFKEQSASFKNLDFNEANGWEKGLISSKTINVTSDNSGTTFSLEKTAEQKLRNAEDWVVKVDGKAYAIVTDPKVSLSENQVLVDVATGNLTFKDSVSADSSISINYIEESDESYYTSFSISSKTSSGNRADTFLISSEDSLNTVINKVNSSKAGVMMFYDSYTGQMTMSRNETGRFNDEKEGAVTKDGVKISLDSIEQNAQGKWVTKAAIKIDDDQTIAGGTEVNITYKNEVTMSGTFLIDTLGFDSSNVQKAENARFTINGLETERASNTFDISGVTFTLKQTFEEAVSTNVSNDSNAIYDNIKSFVDKYNELISTVQSKIGEERNRDYEPLTDEEKEALSETQIEQWENIAKTGLLRNDTTLSSALSNLRLNFSSTVVNGEISSLYNTLSKIGITTTSNYLEGGKLVIDEAKLKAAIEADPNSVEQLFRGENGIVDKLTDTVNNTMENIKLKAGNSFSTNQTFTLGRELDSVDDRISSLQDRLEQIESRYWKQFTAMETAIQRANEQYASLSSFFSPGQ